MDNENFSPVIDKKKKKVEAKHGLKPFAFFSGLFDIIVAAAIIGLGIWICVDMFNSIDTGVTEELDKLLGAFLWPLFIIILAIAGTAGILFFVDGVLSIISSFKSDRKNWNGVITAASVFDVLLLFPAIFVDFASDGNLRILSIALTVILIVTFIFKMIDISLTRRRLKKYAAAKQEEYKETYHGPDFSRLGKNSDDNTPNTQNNSQNAENTEQSNDESEGDSSGGVDFSQLGK